MSGFGNSGGFGSAGFGANPNNSQGGFGGGFGSSSTYQPPQQQSFGGFGGFPAPFGTFAAPATGSVQPPAGASPPTAFGSSSHVLTGFGSAPAPSGSSGFGGGGGFGSAPSSSGFGAGGFGSSTSVPQPSSGFGSSTPAHASGFGSSLSSGFGTTATGGSAFGSAPAFAPTNPSGFGGAPASGFGTSSSSTPTSAGGFGGPPSSGFGTSTISAGGFGGPPTSGFGTSTTSAGGFGGPPTSGFGTSTPTSAGGFGGLPTSGFGSSSTHSAGGFGGAPTSGFGASTTSAGGFGGPPASGFGTTSTTTSAGGFGSNTPVPPSGSAPPSGFGSSSNYGSSGFGGGFGVAAPTPSRFSTHASSSDAPPYTGFGSAPSSGITFGASSNDTSGSYTPNTHRVGQSNAGSWGGKPNTYSSSNPFGSGSLAGDVNYDDGMVDGGAPTSVFSMAGSHRDGNNNMTIRPNKPLSPLPEAGMGDAYDDSEADDRKKAEVELKAKIEEKKRLLQVKLEEKKKKLLEKQGERKIHAPVPDETTAFIPSNTRFASSGASDPRKDSQSLAERNAVRFGDQANSSLASRDMLPAEMRVKAQMSQHLRATSPEMAGTFDQQKSTAREDLHTAKALVGTCDFFCPDEELLRREGENDIQQLEIPLPGKLHPADWTLRNTVVKRFRRSAADYKLDVPEWVRPPDVLEQVCGYLEEWVMERDRQGPDPRFPQGQTPPSLEVYQFIWDRTRMIRKDFTLQNYVGTGGQCDARAVRCHERIARWHAMCEHQLSHIPDFVTMQSQQNIQELGQTMKTLNQFYDDSLRRATIEVPDEHGNETRRDLSGFSHGCSSNDVQGKAPLEFDGTDLDNSVSSPRISQRILGKHAVNHHARGTAEPEMRGIYMLLTMNNEGGMEVLKYAAKLFQDRPEIYHSRPVQLALDIFKAKKEYNYARFFSILRAPTTPYLFCCIMFKHVELMRKVAFRIMSKAFGARKKDTGEGIYDAYPLSRLVDLLCFEDLSEARAACEHYGITVKRVKSSTSDHVSDIIYWKISEFREPTHPEKNYVIPLPPWKMTRTIERKLDGATRLAVCRGQASGEGATLQPMSLGAPSPPTISNPFPSAEERADAAARLRRQQVEAEQLEEQRRLKEQERQALERKKKEDEEKRHLRQAQEAREKEEEKRRQKEEEERVAAAKLAQEQARALAMEAEAKKRAEEALRMAEEEKKLAIEKQRQQEEEEEYRRKRERERRQRMLEQQQRIEEAKRQEHIRRELDAQHKREAEERRQAKDWEDKVDAAKKILMWRRWKIRVSRSIEGTQGSCVSLRRLDPTFVSNVFDLQPLYDKTRQRSSLDADISHGDRSLDIRRALEACNQDVTTRLSLSKMALDEMVSSQLSDSSKGALLMKVALLIPHTIGEDSKKMADLLFSWLDTRVGIDKVDSTHLYVSGSPHTIRSRSVVHLCHTPEDCLDCDVALIVVPPPWSTSRERGEMLSSCASILDDSMPRMALALGDYDQEGYTHMKSFLVETLWPRSGSLKIICNRVVSVEAIERALESICRSAASAFVKESCVEIDRMTIPAIASKAVSLYLWSQLSTQRATDPNETLECARSAISTLIAETEQVLKHNDEIWSSWPPKDFVSCGGVQGYFSDGSSLPADWRSSLLRENFGQDLCVIQNRLMGSFRDVVESLLFDAPAEIREDCSILVAKGFHRRCLQLAMEGFAKYTDNSEQRFAYFPRGTLEMIMDKLSKTNGNLLSESIPSLINLAPDTTLLDITPSTNGDVLQESVMLMAKQTGTAPSIFPTPTTSKRRRSGPSLSSQPYDYQQPVSGEPKRARGSNILKGHRDLDESAALTKKMQDLLDGGTVDLLIGDSFLSRILRDVPKMDTN